MRRIGSTKELGLVLKDKRSQKNFTQGEIANLGGLRQATISDLERNSGKARIETLFKVLATLELDIYIADKSESLSSDKGEHW